VELLLEKLDWLPWSFLLLLEGPVQYFVR